MEQLTIVVPTLFGVESITAREIKALGYEVVRVEDGRVTFTGDASAVCRANLWLRTGERVLIQIGQFEAVTFDELFEKSKALPWEKWITKHVAFPVKGSSVKSKLFSVSDCQSILKKSIVERLKQSYDVDWFDEQGAVYQVVFTILRDQVTLMLDTSGAGLHKRGYRLKSNQAPLRETVAAALLELSVWHENRPFADPFCGSGTFPIEAAMIASRRAPGLHRPFAGEKFSQLDRHLWNQAREEAEDLYLREAAPMIFGYDIDPDCVALSLENARRAGVEHMISVSERDVAAFYQPEEYGVVVCNPPYGERLGDVKSARRLYRLMGRQFGECPTWSVYALTSDEEFEQFYGKKADKKRKIYNGMLKCDCYQYFGPKPPYRRVRG